MPAGPNRWRGNLTVDLPGSSNVPLTGPGFRADLEHPRGQPDPWPTSTPWKPNLTGVSPPRWKPAPTSPLPCLPS